jgi:biopolymer transport protein ExbD
VERNTIYVTKAGDLYYLNVREGEQPSADAPPKEGQKMTPEELRAQLTELAKNDPKAQISILAQKDTDYQHIISVMSEASQAGIKQVQLPYEYAQPPAP